MTINPSNYPSVSGFSKNKLTNSSSLFSASMRIGTLFLLLFSNLFVNIEAKNIQQIPASKLKDVVANAPKSAQSKAKAKTTKAKIKKAKAAPKDTIRDVDPANTSSPLYEKN